MRSLAVLVAVCVAAGALGFDAAVSGGASCTSNLDCGIPASNLATLLDQTLSQTGVCINGTCQCAPGFGCPHCDVRLDVAGTAWVAMTVSDGFLDMCTIQRGGASCGSSFDCGLGGVCVNSKCVCQDGWNCNLCSQKIKQDTLAGARCDKFVTGGGMCVNNWDCNQGSCVSGRCVCNPSYGCTQCTQRVDALISGSAQCSCTNVTCSGHGECSHGMCACYLGWSGVDCNNQACGGRDCGAHGFCNLTSNLCECQPGYSGSDCSMGGGLCSTDRDCGMNVNGGTGGVCNNQTRACECNSGYTCTHCETVGSVCEDGAGGGLCKSDNDCGKHIYGPGGVCVKYPGAVYGKCSCYDGYTCSNCEKSGAVCSKAAGGGSCTDDYDCTYLGKSTYAGKCMNGKCSCFSGFTCPYCSSTGYECSTSSGGAPCSDDTECGSIPGVRDAGKCMFGRCICKSGYTCARCTAVGEECSTALGGGLCRSNSDCGADPKAPNGKCVGLNSGGIGVCECSAAYGCPNCDINVAWLAAGRKCDFQLIAGGAYSNQTANRSLKPGAGVSLTTQKVYLGLQISGAAIGGLILILGLLECRRWHVMKKAVEAETKKTEERKQRKASKVQQHQARQPQPATTNGEFNSVTPVMPGEIPKSTSPTVNRAPSSVAGRRSRMSALGTSASKQQLLTAHLDQNPDVGIAMGLSPKNNWKVREGAVLPAERITPVANRQDEGKVENFDSD